ncbi:hypothetical protein JWJ90_00145 [Desulfobulbus rhabdoformis]|uniref:hypothetical protein n=1 Tax=Desulfobulbus rhabdoformis TaxID=34032 RepID=UPI001962E976|nr:hypothetical protein [Desulfobulbus rhabdoformis]MBM9612689.1 hypothetical protein [Desulfobulbus rhabdoformis]
MTNIQEEGGLVFQFPAGWEVSKYDQWTYYRRHFQKVCASKAVDILGLAPGHGGTLWMIEIKDYRRERRTKSIPIADEVVQKVRDTLAGIFAAGKMASLDEERCFARKCCQIRQVRVVLHLEQPAQTAKLFPRAFDPANVQLKLRTVLKAIDPHSRVVDHRQLPDSLGVAGGVSVTILQQPIFSPIRPHRIASSDKACLNESGALDERLSADCHHCV